MKVLCYGSFLTVLVYNQANSSNQKKLCGTMLLSLDPNDDRKDDDGFASALARGKSNLPDGALDAAPKADPKKITDYFRRNVLPYLDPNKKAAVVATIKDIIASDNNILGDTVIEMVNGIKKSDLPQRRHFVYEEFLAGVFLYTCITPKNAGNIQNVKELTDEYLSSFDAEAADIIFVPDHNKLDAVFADEIKIDAHHIALLTEVGGKCTACGRALATSIDSTDTDYSQIVMIDGEEIILCVDCARKAKNYTETQIADLLSQKEEMTIKTAIVDAVARNEIERQIEEALREIDQLDEAPETKLKTDPAPVERKIKGKRLRRDVLNDVLPLFDGVNEILDRLSAEGVFNIVKLEKNIRRMSEDALTGQLSQDEIFDVLVETLYNKTGRKYRAACRIVISYFVQSCEVFEVTNETTK